MFVSERARAKCRGNCLLAFVAMASFAAGSANGEDKPSPPRADSDSARIERLEKLLGTVVEENRRLAGEVRELKRQIDTRSAETKDPRLQRVTDDTPDPPREAPLLPQAPEPSPPQTPGLVPPQVSPVEAMSSDVMTNLDAGLWDPMDLIDSSDVPEDFGKVPAIPPQRQDRFRVDYENGFTIVPLNPEETPFSLRVRSQNVFRYTGFARDASFWTDSAGNRVPIANANYFGIPRGRIIFSGTALLPELRYLLNIDYNTVTSDPIGFRAYVLSYRFSEAIELSVGQSKVPGSREWLESAFAPLQGPDRSMATTFFRPSLSQGIWITGQPAEGWHYHAMVSNGFNTLNL